MVNTFSVAKVFVLNDQGELLVIRRSQTDDRRPGQWDLPGGWVDPGEDFTKAVIREAKEEVGLTVTDPRPVFGWSEMTTNHGSGTWLFYVVRVPGRPAVTLSDEHDASDWKKPEQLLKELVYDRQIRPLRYLIDNHLLED